MRFLARAGPLTIAALMAVVALLAFSSRAPAAYAASVDCDQVGQFSHDGATLPDQATSINGTITVPSAHEAATRSIILSSIERSPGGLYAVVVPTLPERFATLTFDSTTLRGVNTASGDLPMSLIHPSLANHTFVTEGAYVERAADGVPFAHTAIGVDNGAHPAMMQLTPEKGSPSNLTGILLTGVVVLFAGGLWRILRPNLRC